MLKILVYGFMLLCNVVLYSSDKYEALHRLGFDKKNNMVQSLVVANQVAQIISDIDSTNTKDTTLGIKSFKAKSQIVQVLQNAPLKDVLGSYNVLFSLNIPVNIPESFKSFLNKECVRLLTNFVSKKQEQKIDLGDLNLVDQEQELKEQLINIFATSNNVVTFSQNSIHIDVSNTKDQEIMYEVIKPDKNLYVYSITKKPQSLFQLNLSSKTINEITVQSNSNIIEFFKYVNLGALLSYKDNEVHITDTYDVNNTSILKKFDAEVIKATFSTDRSSIYVLTLQGNELTCYKYHYLEEVGKVILVYSANDLKIINLVNSSDNNQVFVECSYNNDKNKSPSSRLYDLIRFSFVNEANMYYSVEKMHIDQEQKFDVRLLGNLIAYKTKNKIHLYDSFFCKEIYAFGIERCRSIVGFANDGSLWLRMASLPDQMQPSKKTGPDYLLSYTVQNKEKLKVIKEKIKENLNISQCLDLLTKDRSNRVMWYESAYVTIYGKEFYADKKKELKIQQDLIKKAEMIEEAKKLIEDIKQINKEHKIQQNANLLNIQNSRRNRQGIARRQQLLATGQYQIPSNLQAPLPAGSPIPTLPNFIQRAWSAVKTVINGTVNFISATIVEPLLRWIGLI